MLLIRMLQDGYIAMNSSGQTVFSSGEEHELLFRFLETDSEPVTKWLMKYFNSVVDPKTLDLLEGKPNASALKKAQTAIEALHPFYRYNDYYSVLSEMLAHHLNLCMLMSAHADTQYSLEWYKERLKPLAGNLLHDSTIQQQHVGDKQIYMALPNPTLKYDVFEKAFYEKYLAACESGDITVTAMHGVKYATFLQNQFRHRVYWLLDASARHFSKLNFDQRARLYRNLFSSELGVSDLRIVKHLSFADPRRTDTHPLSVRAAKITAVLQASEEGTLEEYMRKQEGANDSQTIDMDTRKLFSQIRDNSVVLDPELLQELHKAIGAAAGEHEPALYEEYETSTLYQLLFLELEQLMKNGAIVKRCRLCDRYFITTNKNIDYCNHIAEGETQPCSEIGSNRAYLKKLEEDYPLQTYNRAYKTHFARKRNGVMTQDEFDDWRDEARGMLEAVRSGELDADEYAIWLKK